MKDLLHAIQVVGRDINGEVGKRGTKFEVLDVIVDISVRPIGQLEMGKAWKEGNGDRLGLNQESKELHRDCELFESFETIYFVERFSKVLVEGKLEGRFKVFQWF